MGVAATPADPPHAAVGRRALTVASWTLLSRVTGLVRVVVVGAVLGATFFANTFQSTNTLPNLVYTLVAGSVLTMVVVPAIVRAIGASTGGRPVELVQRLTALVVTASAGLAVLLVVASPVLAFALTGGIPSADERRRAQGFVIVLVLFVAPQVVLYTVAALGASAQNACGRFALAAAAPAVENVILIATCIAVGIHYGTGLEVAEVPVSMVVVLGVGSTLAVAAHAGLQMFGAGRAGLPLRWRRGWRSDPEARRIARHLAGSIRVAALPSAGMLAAIVFASRVPGGVVILQTAITLYNLPAALGARAVSTAVLPGLSAAAAAENDVAFAASWRRGLDLSVVSGAAAMCVIVVLASPIADVLANGELRTSHLIGQLAICIAILGVAQLAAGIHEVGRQALYARLDLRGPQRASTLLFATLVVVGGISLIMPSDAARLAMLCVAFVAADAVAATTVIGRLRRQLAGHTVVDRHGLMLIAKAAGLAVPVALAGSWVLRGLEGHRLIEVVFLAATGAAFAAVFGLVAAPVLRGRRRGDDEDPQPDADPGAGDGSVWVGNLDAGNVGDLEAGHARDLESGNLEARNVDVAVAPAALDRPASTGEISTRVLIAGALALSVLAGATAALAGPLVPVALAALAIGGVAAWRPTFATYAYLVTLPFLAGIERGRFVPLVRLNEAVLALLVAGALAGAFGRYVGGQDLHWRRHPLDTRLVGFALLATFWPVLSLLLRGNMPTFSELFAVVPVLKLAGVLVLVRLTIRTPEQIERCVRIVVWTATVIALIAILQAIGAGFVHSLLETWWPVASDSSEVGTRGSTTLASPIATGDYLIIGLAFVATFGVRGMLGERERLACGFVLAAGLLAAGQFSTWGAAEVVAIVLWMQEPAIRRQAVRFLPLLPVIVAIGAPAFVTRIMGFFEGFGVPRSWLGRWDNITSFYLPDLGGFRFVLGVSPQTVLQAPETWRTEIYLESGYLSFLYIGGIPLLVGFFWLSAGVLRNARQLVSRQDSIGAVASTLRGVWWMVIVLSIIDIHLVLRGCGDLLAVMLAMTTGALVSKGVIERDRQLV